MKNKIQNDWKYMRLIVPSIKDVDLQSTRDNFIKRSPYIQQALGKKYLQPLKNLKESKEGHDHLNQSEQLSNSKYRYASQQQSQNQEEINNTEISEQKQNNNNNNSANIKKSHYVKLSDINSGKFLINKMKNSLMQEFQGKDKKMNSYIKKRQEKLKNKFEIFDMTYHKIESSESESEHNNEQFLKGNQLNKSDISNNINCNKNIKQQESDIIEFAAKQNKKYQSKLLDQSIKKINISQIQIQNQIMSELQQQKQSMQEQMRLQSQTPQIDEQQFQLYQQQNSGSFSGRKQQQSLLKNQNYWNVLVQEKEEVLKKKLKKLDKQKEKMLEEASKNFDKMKFDHQEKEKENSNTKIFQDISKKIHKFYLQEKNQQIDIINKQFNEAEVFDQNKLYQINKEKNLSSNDGLREFNHRDLQKLISREKNQQRRLKLFLSLSGNQNYKLQYQHNSTSSPHNQIGVTQRNPNERGNSVVSQQQQHEDSQNLQNISRSGHNNNTKQIINNDIFENNNNNEEDDDDNNDNDKIQNKKNIKILGFLNKNLNNKSQQQKIKNPDNNDVKQIQSLCIDEQQFMGQNKSSRYSEQQYGYADKVRKIISNYKKKNNYNNEFSEKIYNSNNVSPQINYFQNSKIK